MPGEAEETPTIDPIVCRYCHHPIEEGQKFVEIKTNMGVKVPDINKGYIKGIYSEPYWESETEYVHLSHILFAALVE